MIALAALLSIAQFRCDAPTNDPWLTPKGYEVRGTETVSRGQVYRVRAEARGEAIRRLATKTVVALPPSQVAQFAGNGVLTNAPLGIMPSGSPYLVRSVFSVPNPQISVSWAGTRLLVETDGLGCAPFTGEPLIVWLERAPSDVVATASAAL